MKRLWIVLLCAAACGCGQDFLRHQPPSSTKVAVRLAVNKSPQFGLEDKLTNAIRDEGLKEGHFPVVTEDQADRIILVIIQRYTVLPAQYDSNLNPTAYKLRIGVDLQLLTRSGKMIWQEKDMDDVQSYASGSLAGGLDETGAQALIWDSLSRDIVDRVAQGIDAAPPPEQPAAPATLVSISEH